MSPKYGRATGAKTVIRPPTIKIMLNGMIILMSILYPYPE
jgi:hypothetical protein